MGDYFNKEIHIGKSVKELIDKKRMSIEKDLAPALQKSKQGLYADMHRQDWYLQDLKKILDLMDVSTCDFLEKIGMCAPKTQPIVNESAKGYGNAVGQNSELLKKENEFLSRILDEKERLIQEKERLIEMLRKQE